jgi:mono/diheme cytochrome c family protein
VKLKQGVQGFMLKKPYNPFDTARNRRWQWAAVFVLLGIFLVVSASNGDDSTSKPPSLSADLLAEGEVVYRNHCAACHGPNGEGQNPNDPYAADANGRFLAPPHNANGHTWHHDDDLLFRIVKEGGMGDPQFFNEMPAFGHILTDYQIQAVLTYIKTFWTEEQRLRQSQRTEAVRAGQ